jgi:hypothetical protein
MIVVILASLIYPMALRLADNTPSVHIFGGPSVETGVTTT